ncbi:MAG: hypothetical protein JWQ64_2244 [Subtercola sp.]|nr:hypothetical protein [Subtercola sp.]
MMTTESPDTRAAGVTEPIFAEDIVVGHEFDLGSYPMTTKGITSFAAQWDPLPLHLSEAAAAETTFGRLVASGVQTLAVFQRLCVLSVFVKWSIFAGRRFDDVRMLGPVYPGTTLYAGMIVRSVQHNHPSRSLVTCSGWISDGNQNVLELVFECYVNRRSLTIV